MLPTSLTPSRAASLADKLKLPFALIHSDRRHFTRDRQPPLHWSTGASECGSSFSPREFVHEDAAPNSSLSSSDNECDEGVSRNDRNSGEISLAGDVRGKTVFLFDDIIAHARTFIEYSLILTEKYGAHSISVIATHCLLSASCVAAIDECASIDQASIISLKIFPYYTFVVSSL